MRPAPGQELIGPAPISEDPRIASSVQSATVATGGTLPYVELGDSDGAPLVLLHGPTDSWRSFMPLLVELPASIHAFAPSQRGHGDGDHTGARLRPEDLATDLAAFMDAVGLEGAVVLGHSGAGFTAQTFARHHPDRALGLVLVATPLTLSHDPEFAEFLRTVTGLSDPIDPAFVREFVAGTTTDAVPPEFLEIVIAEALKVPAHIWRAAFFGLLDAEDPRTATALDLPTLLIWGERDEICSREDQDSLLHAIEGARLVTLPDAGHSPHWEDPKRCAAEIAEFSRAAQRRHT